MKPVHLSTCYAIVTHPSQWTVTEMRIKKGFYENASFREVHITSYPG